MWVNTILNIIGASNYNINSKQLLFFLYCVDGLQDLLGSNPTEVRSIKLLMSLANLAVCWVSMWALDGPCWKPLYPVVFFNFRAQNQYQHTRKLISKLESCWQSGVTKNLRSIYEYLYSKIWKLKWYNVMFNIRNKKDDNI